MADALAAADAQLRPPAGGARAGLRLCRGGSRRCNAREAGMTAHASSVAPVPDAGRLAMWILIATEIVFFGGLFAAYLYGRTHWTQGFGIASQRTDVLLGTANTAVLLTSSALVALAVDCA